MTATNHSAATGASIEMTKAREFDRPTLSNSSLDQIRRTGPRILRFAGEILKSTFRLGFGELGYAASRPGEPDRANGIGITVRKSVRYWPSIAIYRPTVWVEDGCNLWQLLFYAASWKWKVGRSEKLHPGIDATRYEEWGLGQMRAATDTAKFIALSYLGYDVTQHGEGALVVAVGPGPAYGLLNEQDVIVRVGEDKVKFADDVTRLLKSTASGGAVELIVEPANPSETVQKKVVVHLASRPPLLGAIVRTHNLSYGFPVDIDISAEGAGSSGSLAMALGIIDVLTKEDLCTVATAATGMLKRDGSIGEVTGVSQKARSLRRSEVRRFLVPKGAGEEARTAAADDLEVIEVANLMEALEALARPQP